MVEGAATCACESGYYAVGLACLEDPCEQGGTCYYVDADTGVDTNDGSKSSPWRTLDRVEAAMNSLNPGAYVLFRRGGQWLTEGSLDIRNIIGTEESPVTFGTYGPLTDALPKLRAVRIQDSSHVTLRDVESTGSDGGPCISISIADHVIVHGVTAHDCTSNGIHFGKETSFGAMLDNRVFDIGANDALVVHESSSATPQTKLGDHFWIADNRVPGGVAEQPVDVATGNDDWPGSRDIKVVGNWLTGGGNGCVALGHGTSVAWIIGNLMGQCTRTETAFAVGVGGTHQENSGTDYHISGNVVFYNLMSSVLARSEAPAVYSAWITHNTFIGIVSKRSIVNVAYAPAHITFSNNIVWTTDGQAHVALTSPDVVEAMDYNAYIPGSDPDCKVSGQSLSDWQDASGYDANSSCAEVPGLSLPTKSEVEDFDNWGDSAFLERFIPDAAWSGCQDEIGAFDCSGKRRIEFEPIPTYSYNNGYGWAGPLIVRQRYPVGP